MELFASPAAMIPMLLYLSTVTVPARSQNNAGGNQDTTACAGRGTLDGLQCGTGGTCVEMDTGAVCRCSADYTGEKCDVFYCPNCKAEQCDGTGRCSSGCELGFSGIFCTELIGSRQDVRMVLDGEFTPGLNDENSQEYKKMSEAIKTFTEEALKNEGRVESGTMYFLDGSVIAKYTIITKNEDESSENIMKTLRDNASKFILEGYALDVNSITSIKIGRQGQSQVTGNTGSPRGNTYGFIVLLFLFAICASLIVFFFILEWKRNKTPPPATEWNPNNEADVPNVRVDQKQKKKKSVLLSGRRYKLMIKTAKR